MRKGTRQPHRINITPPTFHCLSPPLLQMEVMLPETATVPVLAELPIGARRSSASSSPEFEFWMVRNPSFPQPNLLSADELFVDGIILPLHLLPTHHDPVNSDQPEPNSTESPPETLASISPASVSAPVGPSKRWKDIFRGVGGVDRKLEEKARRRNRKNSVGGATELNINIWPFSRSRSAGNSTSAGIRQKGNSTARKASSAPCSRSNSRGESSSKLASSKTPVRSGGGVHVGRTSPIWQMRRGGKKSAATAPVVVVEGKEASEGENAGGGGGGGKKSNGSVGVGIRVLNLNVNTCIGYKQQVRCGVDEEESLTGDEQIVVTDGGSSHGGVTGSHFKLKALFSKKVH